MSIILQALNRSRREQHGQEVPTLDTDHFERPPARRWRFGLYSPLVFFGFTGALVVVSGILVWYLWWPDAAPVDGVREPLAGHAAVSASAVRVGTPAPAGSRSLSRAEKPVADAPLVATDPALDPAVAALYDDEDSALIHDASPSATHSIADSGEAPVQAVESAAQGSPETLPTVAPAGAAQTVSEITDTPIDIADVVSRVQQALGERPLAPHPTPLIERLSQQVKDRIPTVIYSVHDYRGDGQSAVVLNGQRLSEGKRQDGFTVLEILADSVVLRWNDIDFRLRALNSWVNL